MRMEREVAWTRESDQVGSCELFACCSVVFTFTNLYNFSGLELDITASKFKKNVSTLRTKALRQKVNSVSTTGPSHFMTLVKCVPQQQDVLYNKCASY